MGEPHVVTLRTTRAEDLDALFRFEQDPVTSRMAAVTPPDPTDRATFDAHWRRLLSDPAIDARTVRADGEIVGSVVRWFDGDVAEITCWIDPAHWGRHIATRAVRLFLDTLRERPIRARAAAGNGASVVVLEKLGFRRVGVERGVANAREVEIDEVVYRLD